jgi:hypothetical protein
MGLWSQNQDAAITVNADKLKREREALHERFFREVLLFRVFDAGRLKP